MSDVPDGPDELDEGVVAGWVCHLVGAGTRAAVPAPEPHTLAAAWPRVVERVRQGRITGTLADLVTRRTDLVTPERVDEALAYHRSAMALALRLERVLLGVHAVLDEAGIRHLVLKGPAVAHLDHPDPSEREFGDVDILVPTDAVSAAVATLEGAGLRRLLPSAHPRLDVVFGKSVTFQDPDGFEVDLHRTLTPGRFGLRMPLDRLWADTDRFTVGGIELAALSPLHRLANTVVHLQLGSTAPHLSTARDMLVQAGRHPVDDIVGVADQLGLAVVLQAAVRRLVGAGTPPAADLVAWADGYRPDPAAAAHLAAHLGAGDDFGIRTRDALAELPWRDRAVVVGALVLPRRAHLEARGLTRRQHLRRLWSRRRS